MNSQRLNGLILLLVTLTCACTPARIIIKGQVADQTGLPITEAEVTTEPKTDVVFTDQNGFFYLTKSIMGDSVQETPIKPGTYVITVKKDGFEPLKIPVQAEGGEVFINKHLMKKEAGLMNDVGSTKITDDDNQETGAGGDVTIGL